ncbi:MAG: hypothetical protein MUC77_18135 [Chromatiaceae bacterium]|nr:hypothetical protein [Chromatiaceae bacterium]
MSQTHSTRKPPEAFTRRILLMVTGRTPQVVTEKIDAACRPADIELACDAAKL